MLAAFKHAGHCNTAVFTEEETIIPAAVKVALSTAHVGICGEPHTGSDDALY